MFDLWPAGCNIHVRFFVSVLICVPLQMKYWNHPLAIFGIGKLTVMTGEVIYRGDGICDHMFCITFLLRQWNYSHPYFTVGGVIFTMTFHYSRSPLISKNWSLNVGPQSYLTKEILWVYQNYIAYAVFKTNISLYTAESILYCYYSLWNCLFWTPETLFSFSLKQTTKKWGAVIV